MISAILTQDPVPMVDRQPQTPGNFQFAVESALPKTPTTGGRARASGARAGMDPRDRARDQADAWAPLVATRCRWLAAAVIVFVIVAGVLASPYLVGGAESRGLVLLPCAVIGGSEGDQVFATG